MLRLLFTACALLASAVCVARPMVIYQSQAIHPPAGSGYYFFGESVAIEGDWAFLTASTYSAGPTLPTQRHDALLYRRVNGTWTFDRVLLTRTTQYGGTYNGFGRVAMKNGVLIIGSGPTRMFRLSGSNWNEIAHPFTAPAGDPDFVTGEFVWDGTRLLAGRGGCYFYQQRPWGALISRFNPDGTWSPVEQLVSDDVACNLSVNSWGISGDTVVAGTWTNDYESAPDQLKIFRRNGSTWVPTSAIPQGNGEADVRGNEIFKASNGPGGTLVYRNDDTQTVIDNVRTVSASYRGAGASWGFTHTNDVFIQDRDVFQKNAVGKYEHVASLMTEGYYTMYDDARVNGQRLISSAWYNGTSANQAVLFYDLPSTYTPSPVFATGFSNGVSPFTPQRGSFTVATTPSGNRVYRQSSLTGDYRALLGDSNWIEQSIEADITPTAFSGNDRWVGLAVRYQDDANYYYVTLRSSGVIALRRMRNGVFTTMVERQVPIVAGQRYRLSLQASHTMIMVRIDGKEYIWSFDQDPIPRGRAALLGYRAAVDYDNVVVAEAGQRPIYDLSDDGCYGSLANMPHWASNAGTWNCASSTGENILQQTSTAGDARATVGSPTDDQVITARARLTAVNGADRWFGMAARYVDPANYYYLSLRTSNSVSIRKLVNGVITVLGTATLPVSANTWYDLRLDAVGNELAAFVNGTQVLQVTDNSLASGQGGLLSYKAAAEWQSYFTWQP